MKLPPLREAQRCPGGAGPGPGPGPRAWAWAWACSGWRPPPRLPGSGRLWPPQGALRLCDTISGVAPAEETYRNKPKWAPAEEEENPSLSIKFLPPKSWGCRTLVILLFSWGRVKLSTWAPRGTPKGQAWHLGKGRDSRMSGLIISKLLFSLFFISLGYDY